LPAAGGAVTLSHMHCRVATEGARERVLAVPAVSVRARRSIRQGRGEHGWPLLEVDVLGGRTSASRLPDGRAITVAVADTGVDLDHPALAPISGSTRTSAQATGSTSTPMASRTTSARPTSSTATVTRPHLSR
jgi:hypothetical protein